MPGTGRAGRARQPGQAQPTAQASQPPRRSRADGTAALTGLAESVGAVRHNLLVLLNEVVVTSAAVAGTPARLAKIAAIADLLARVPAEEVAIAVAFLSGELTQRQIGVGYAALFDLSDSGDDVVSPADDPPPPGEPVLTLTQTDAAFEAIGSLSGSGSQAQRRSRLAALFGLATDGERQFLVRLIAGDLGQGALQGVMADAIARAAGIPAAEVRRAHQLCGSLSEVATAALLAAGQRGDQPGGPGDLVTAAEQTAQQRAIAALRAFTLVVGRPVKPMLAASAPSLQAAMSRISPAAIEWKIDGIRVQIHRDGPSVRVFTRTLEDITARVGEIEAIGLSLDVDRAVVDAEVVALRPDGRPRPFQVTAARVASQSAPGAPGPAGGVPQDGAERVALTAFLFDLLYADGHSMIDEPAGERFGRLAAIAPPGLLIPRVVTADGDEAAEFFADALRRGHEGVVVKSVQAPYRTGRRGSDWIKVKLRTTLDLVILAAEWGHGRRRGLLSNLHLGARDPDTGGFVMLGKTFKGLTDAMLAWQTERLLELAGQPAGQPAPAGGGDGEPAAARTAREHWERHGVVRVPPVLVAEIAFDGVQASRRYPGGVALRFARVLRYRPDKQASEADTIEAVRALWPAEPAE